MSDPLPRRASIVVACMARNEADRYLPSALAAWSDWAERIVLLDNGSEDGTEELAARFGKVIYGRYEEPAWGNEVQVRKKLWEMASAVCREDGWIFVLDADMVPAADPRRWLEVGRVHAAVFNLYDLWAGDPDGRLYYRTDGPWKAHEVWRAWAIRKDVVQGPPRWPERGIHCGHFPVNTRLGAAVHVPRYAGLLHYACLDPADREAKVRQYREQAEQMTDAEIAHAESIVDRRVHLRALDFEPQYRLRKEEK